MSSNIVRPVNVQEMFTDNVHLYITGENTFSENQFYIIVFYRIPWDASAMSTICSMVPDFQCQSMGSDYVGGAEKPC